MAHLAAPRHAPAIQKLTEFDEGFLAGVQATRDALAREEPTMRLAGFELHRATGILTFPGGVARLSRKERAIFELFMTGRCVSQESILAAAWPLGTDSDDDRLLVAVHLANIRRKLPRGSIVCRWGQGWMINQDVAP